MEAQGARHAQNEVEPDLSCFLAVANVGRLAFVSEQGFENHENKSSMKCLISRDKGYLEAAGVVQSP
jgi:hypothetical protein